MRIACPYLFNVQVLVVLIPIIEVIQEEDQPVLKFLDFLSELLILHPQVL
jgi:hypothetical protein